MEKPGSLQSMGVARESDTTIGNEPTITRAEGAGWGGTGNDTGRMADGKI